jgi:hypothetical protein
MIYVVGSLDENEILLYNAVLAIRDSLHLVFKYGFPHSLAWRSLPGHSPMS